MADKIDFASAIGPVCPICGKKDCYRSITPYLRNAIELSPDFENRRIHIARFLCKKQKLTFSLLPIQLIPYFQYTASAVVWALLLSIRFYLSNYRGPGVELHPDSKVTPWLVAYWLAAALKGLHRAHAMLGRIYDLSGVSTSMRSISWQELHVYFLALGLKPHTLYRPLLLNLLLRYSDAANQFLFGTPSQLRVSLRQ